MKSGSSLSVKGSAKTDVRILDGMSEDNNTYLGPATTSALAPSDIVFYISATDAPSGLTCAVVMSPKARGGQAGRRRDAGRIPRNLVERKKFQWKSGQQRGVLLPDQRRGLPAGPENDAPEVEFARKDKSSYLAGCHGRTRGSLLYLYPIDANL